MPTNSKSGEFVHVKPVEDIYKVERMRFWEDKSLPQVVLDKFLLAKDDDDVMLELFGSEWPVDFEAGTRLSANQFKAVMIRVRDWEAHASLCQNKGLFTEVPENSPVVQADEEVKGVSDHDSLQPECETRSQISDDQLPFTGGGLSNSSTVYPRQLIRVPGEVKLMIESNAESDKSIKSQAIEGGSEEIGSGSEPIYEVPDRLKDFMINGKLPNCEDEESVDEICPLATDTDSQICTSRI